MRMILFALLLLVGYLTAARYAFVYLERPASAQTLIEEEENIFLLISGTNDFAAMSEAWLAGSASTYSTPTPNTPSTPSTPDSGQGGGAIPAMW